MSSKKFIMSALATMVLASAPAFGASSSRVADSLKTDDAQIQQLSIPLAQNQLSAEIEAEQAQRDRAGAPVSSVEAVVSSWQPKSLSLYSRIDNAPGFAQSGPPSLSVNAIHPFNHYVALKVGAGFMMFHRYASMELGGPQQEQVAYIPSLRLGAEFTSPQISTRVFQPYLSATLLPTMVITSRSAFDDGQSGFGVPFEFGGGMVIRATKAVEVNVGVTDVVGKVKDSDLSGFGVNGGVRLPL